MLAYVFWHRPRAGADPAAYEEAQRAFHASLAVPSACFRIEALPFGDRGPAYEDWYLVEDWAGLGELNTVAVDAGHRPSHDAAASLSAEGWAGVLALVSGPAVIPAGIEWLPATFSIHDMEKVTEVEGATVWQRQMVLGPAPEFCLATARSAGRTQVWPAD